MPACRFPLLMVLVVLIGCGDETPSSPAENEASALVLPSGNVVDLSHAFNEETIYWPTEDGFRREVTAEGETEDGYYYSAGTFTSAEHGGTHVDAPIHFAEGAHSVEEIPLERLMGPAVVVDVSEHVDANPDYLIAVEDLESWENDHAPLRDGVIVLFRTGFGELWPDRERYLGTDERGAEAVAQLHFPGLSAEAARWLVENRSIGAVGIDTPSIDYGQSQQFEAHQILSAENIPALENVANLDQVPDEGSIVIALPMKIEGGSGGPVRIVAFLP